MQERPDETDEYAGLARQLRILASGTETGGSFGLVEYTLQPYSPGPGLHSHSGHVEGCVLIEGMLAVTCGGQTVMLAPGAVQIIPAGERHRCWNPTSATARMLLIFAPCAGEAALLRLALGQGEREDEAPAP